MELKVRCVVAHGVEAAQFQSHLYGIERLQYAGEGMKDGRFNRTFMELKVNSLFTEGETITGFNRTFMELKAKHRQHTRQHRLVSIAPLWNWKHLIVGDERDAIWFQSHLYGIERYASGHKQTHARVSIAPLWNWKTIGGDQQVQRLGFNRTFMELKDRR